MQTQRRKIKLFGGSRHSTKTQKRQLSTARIAVKTMSIALAVLTAGYLLFAFSNIGPIAKLRSIYIETAMSTMRHQWLATAFLPDSVIREVMEKVNDARADQIGVETNWGSEENDPYHTVPSPTDPSASAEEKAFYELFWEIDPDTMTSYLNSHPEALQGGWENLSINEAGLNDDGTTIRTIQDEQVLAIDVPNQVLLVRVKGMSYQGVLAVAKDPSRLKLQATRYEGSVGQFAGDLCEDAGGVLAITASGFIDEGGVGMGGLLAGYAMSDGKGRGTHYGYGYKRLELRDDDRMYIVDAQNSVNSRTTDAAEFWPALIIDGKRMDTSGWSELNPRVSIGQSDRYEVLMLVIEGRLATSIGTTAAEAAEILARHNCMQAMNMDGGTSAIMYYDGEYVTRCSNTALPSGRQLPNAWVYGVKD